MIMENKFLNNKGDKWMQKTADGAFFKPRNGSIRKAMVHFNSFGLENNQPSSIIDAELKSSFKKRNGKQSKLNMLQPPEETAKADQILNGLLTMKILRFPVNLRKNYQETVRIITDLLNSPILSKSSIMRELKCFMSNSSAHDSYLFTKPFCKRVKQQLRQTNGLEKYTFRYEQVAAFVKKLEEKKCDELLDCYNNILNSYTYPPSVELMILYMGVHLFSINSHPEKAEELCYRIHDILLKRRIDRYIPIYFILMIKLKVNQGQWEGCLSFLSRAVTASWLYQQPDLQIWCYFEFSRVYFALGNTQACSFFKERSEMSVVEGRDTIYREMMTQAYQKQLQLVRDNSISYDSQFIISHIQLSKNPVRERPIANLKAQVYAKTISQNFKIKHVKNLIGRLGEEFNRGDGCLPMAGNPQFLTHQSGIKNLNMYFRQGGSQKQLFTFENSFKNALVLKQMVRNTLLEMKWFVPILQS